MKQTPSILFGGKNVDKSKDKKSKERSKSPESLKEGSLPSGSPVPAYTKEAEKAQPRQEKTPVSMPVMVQSGAKDPKSDSAALIQAEKLAHEPSVQTAAKTPEFVGKKRTVKLFVITARKDPKSGKLDLEDSTSEIIPASQAVDSGLINSKYGLLDPSNGTLIITDPANGQKEVVEGSIDPISKQIIVTSGAVINPSTNKKDSSFGQIFAIAEKETVVPTSPLVAVPKKRIFKITVTTAKKDPKSGRIEAEKGHVETLDAILNPMTGEIETKYGVIDTLNKKMKRKDPKSGKIDASNVQIDDTLGQIIISDNVSDPKSGKVDGSLGQLVIISDKGDCVLPITAVTAKRDPSTGQLDINRAHKETTNGKINPKSGAITTKYGTIDVEAKKIINQDPISKKIEERPIQLDSQDNVIILTGVVDPVLGKKDDNLSQILQVGSQIDSELNIISVSGKVDKKGFDPKHSTSDTSTALYDPDSGKIYTKYGIYDPIHETLTYFDPKANKSEVKHGLFNSETNSVLFRGLINPKTGKADSNFGRTIKVEPKYTNVDPSVQSQIIDSDSTKKSPVKTSPVPVSGDTKNKIVKIMVITAKKDPKSKHLDIENGTVDHSAGVLHPSGEIDSKYGIINLEKGTLTISDPTSGSAKVIQGKIDPVTKQIILTEGGVVDPKTGKENENLGQVLTVISENPTENPVTNLLSSHPIPKRRVVKILVITAKKDPKSGKIDAEQGHVEKLTAIVNPVSGIIETKYGNIDPVNGKIVQKDPKTGKATVVPIEINENTGQIYIEENVVDPKTGKVSPNLAQVINVVDPKEPVVIIKVITATKDPKTGLVDVENGRKETTNGTINPKTGEIITKHGTINLKLMRIISKDPKTGEVTERPVHVDKDDNIVIGSGVIDPKTGKPNANLVQLIEVGPEVDPEVQVTTFVGKLDTKKNTIDSKNATPETSVGLFDPELNIIYTKYGLLDPVKETLTVTDPKTNKTDVRQGDTDSQSGDLIFKGGFVNPKTGKHDTHFGRSLSVHLTEPIVDPLALQQPTEAVTKNKEIITPTVVATPTKVETKTSPLKIEQILSKPATPPKPVAQNIVKSPRQGVAPSLSVPKHRIVKIMVITYKKDPKTGQVDVEHGNVEQLTGIYDPVSGFVETKYGLIDPKTGSLIVRDPATGQNETVPGKLDKATGHISIPGGKIPDSQTGKTDQVAGHVFSIIGLKQAQEPAAQTLPKKRTIKITVITTKIDPKTGKPDTEKGQIEQSTATINPTTGLIESKYGLIDPKNGKLIINDQKTGKVDAKSAQLNETGQIFVTNGVVDPKTGKLDNSLGQIISIAGQNDPVVEITTVTGKKDARTGIIDVNNGQMETTRGKVNSATGDILTKYGVINLKLMKITTTDPKTGATETRPILIDQEGNIVIPTGVKDPKTDSVNQDLGQIIKVGQEIEPEAQIITFMAKVDAKKNTIDPKNAVIDVSTGIYSTHSHKVDSKFGQIDPVNGTLTYVDPKTGKQEIKQGIIDPVTGQIIFKGFVNPKTGKHDPNYARIICVLISDPQVDKTGQIVERDVKSFKIDPKSGQVWSFDHQDPVTKQEVYSTGQIDPTTGYIITIYGYLDPKSGSIHKSIKVDPNNAQIDPETNQIYTKTSEIDELGEPLFSVSEIDPKSGDIYTKYGKIDPKTGRLVIVRIYLVSQSDPSGKAKEVDLKDCEIDEKTGRIINVTTQTVYMYSMVDPKTGKIVQVDPNDPLVKSASTRVTQVMTLSGEIDPVTGRVHTEWGDIDPNTGDIDPKTARKDPVTGELILNYAQIDPSHFTDLKDTKVKVKTFTKKSAQNLSDDDSSDEDLSEYGADSLQDVANLKIPHGLTSMSTPVIVKTTTKQIVTKDRDGVTQDIEEKIEDGRTGDVTISKSVNRVSLENIKIYVNIVVQWNIYSY